MTSITASLQSQFDPSDLETSFEIQEFLSRTSNAEKGGFLTPKGASDQEWIERLVLVAVNGRRYDARVRMAIRLAFENIASDVLASAENRLAELLRNKDFVEELDEEEEEPETEAPDRSSSIKALKTAAVVGGGTVVAAVTGGFAAPALGLILSKIGLGALISSVATATGVSGTMLSAGVFGVGGGAAAGVVAHKKLGAEEDETLHLLRVKEPPQNMRVVIGAGDWLPKYGTQDPTHPWDVVLRLSCPEADLMACCWNTMSRKALGAALLEWSKSDGFNAASYPSELWAKVIAGAEQAGRDLAALILSGEAIGRRPMSLVGVGLGGIVMYQCLQVLADECDESHSDDGLAMRDIRYGTIEHCLLIGAPVAASLAEWSRVKKVVCGRLSIVHSARDEWLSLGNEDACGFMGVPGGREIGIDNYDASGVISRHTQLMERQIVHICKHVGILEYGKPTSFEIGNL